MCRSRATEITYHLVQIGVPESDEVTKESPLPHDHPGLTPHQRAQALWKTQSKVAEVLQEEPAISAAVIRAVTQFGGVLERFPSRFKSENSLYRKVQDIMFDDETDAADAIAEVPDALLIHGSRRRERLLGDWVCDRRRARASRIQAGVEVARCPAQVRL